MSVKKKLWNIFGPIITAGLLVFIAVFAANQFVSVNKATEKRAAVSLSSNVYKGSVIKSAALKDGYVPFFGSSELSRMDPFHPDSMAQKYHRNYRPFLLGNPGTQSLSHLMQMQGMKSQIKNKKVVFIISPQWFTKQGQVPQAYNFYNSPIGTIKWIKSATNSSMTRYTAKRILAMNVSGNSGAIHQSLENLADGKKVTAMQKMQLNMSESGLTAEDKLFSAFVSGKNEAKISRDQAKLPKQYDFAKLTKTANHLAAQQSNDNPFGISNSFFKKRLAKGHKLEKLEGSQTEINYLQSPEYADFELILAQFAKWHVDPIFVITPVNQKWVQYTGLSDEMYQKADQKIKYQLSSQGFNHVVDLSADGGKKYFMEDTIHLGWNGWLAMNQKVAPFLEQKQAQPKYQIQSRFISNQWQQAE